MNFTATPIITTKPLPLSNIAHISSVSSDRAWVSNRDGDTILVDTTAEKLNRIKCANGHGVHTAADGGSLLFINQNGNINKIPSDVSAEPVEFIKIEEGKAMCIHFSKLNGDILVAVKASGLHRKVVRYTTTGAKVSEIEFDDHVEALYEDPLYITENVNGDICISDGQKNSVVVVDKSGNREFSYYVSPSGLKLSPSGICTDKEGRILMYDTDSKCVHIIDKDGKFLSFLRGHDKRDVTAPAMCIDNAWNLWTVDCDNKLIVHKYLQTEDGSWMDGYGQGDY